jgi:3-oxoacyl-[acyl-carrier protein] reductase
MNQRDARLRRDLAGKVALVTGASRGIGRAIAERLAADGAVVAVHYGTNDIAATETVAAIEQAGGRAFPIRAELGVDGDIDTLFTALHAELDSYSERLDIVVNNAAIICPSRIEQLTPAEFDRTIAINVRASLFLTQRTLPLLTDGGRVIAISSPVTRTGPPEIAYAMSKGAIDVMVRGLANTLGSRGITVNAVAPGITATDIWADVPGGAEALAGSAAATALGRIGQPDDVADAVAFLASEDARWITGQVLDVTGGLLLRSRGETQGPPRP